MAQLSLTEKQKTLEDVKLVLSHDGLDNAFRHWFQDFLLRNTREIEKQKKLLAASSGPGKIEPFTVRFKSEKIGNKWQHRLYGIEQPATDIFPPQLFTYIIRNKKNAFFQHRPKLHGVERKFEITTKQMQFIENNDTITGTITELTGSPKTLDMAADVREINEYMEKCPPFKQYLLQEFKTIWKAEIDAEYESLNGTLHQT